MYQQLLIFILLLAAVYAGIFSKGYAIYDLERIEECKEYNLVAPLDIKLARCNRTHKCINVKIDIPKEVGAKSTIEMAASKWSDGGWKQNVFNAKINNFCKYFTQLIGQQWHYIEKMMNITCPVQQGMYYLKDYYLPSVIDSKIPVAVMYGTYKFRFTLRNYNQVYFCNDYVTSIKQKV